MKILKYENTMNAARSLATHLNYGQKRFSPRPWNKNIPEDTLWWVVPSNEWPAYRYGKYVLFNDRGYTFCGLHVEKGLGENVALYYPNTIKKGWIMKNDWMWHKFIDDISNNKISQTIQQLQKYNNEKPNLLVRGGLVVDPSDFDPHAPKSDEIWFEFDNDKLEITEVKLPSRVISNLLDAKSLSDIPKILSTMDRDELGCIWIDFHILAKFKTINTNEEYNLSSLMDCNKLYKNVLALLKQWVL
ncbi:hypothetical protein IZY60_05620 [Lutibacter sp. B2]|nr:hypothetical protein [Lutibacter sp. B2]